MEKLKSILKNIFVIFFTIFILLFILEIISRNFVRKISTEVFHFDSSALFWDEEISFHAFKKPSKSIMTNGHFKELIFIDKNGFRVNSIEENIVKPEIITIGDSQTFGHGISNGDTWPNLLAKATGLTIGNWGVWGYGMTHYNPLFIRLTKNFKPRYVVYGLTDNDICSLTNAPGLQKKDKGYGNLGNKSHLLTLINSPKGYFLYHTSLGSMVYSFYENIFYQSSFGLWLRPKIRPGSVKYVNKNCTMLAIKWLREKALFLKNHNIKTIVIQIPPFRRTVSYAKGFSQSNVEKSIKLIKEHQADSFYYFIDPIKELAEHYKKNNYERTSLILPVDGHHNLFSNEILANLLVKKIRELE